MSVSHVTIIWAVSAAVSLTLGAIHGVVWLHDRKARANLCFSIMALAVATFTLFELSLMRAETVERFTTAHRWLHVPLFFTTISLVGFIQFYFRSGRPWLAWAVVALRVVVIVLNFTAGPTFNYRAITGLLPFEFLGETVSVAVGVPSPWARLGEGSGLLLLIFVLDAAIRLWRRGTPNERRRALIVGGSASVFVALAIGNALLIHTGAIHMPYFFSLCFVLIVVAMGCELSRDVVHAAQIAGELRVAEAEAAQHRAELAHLTRVTTLGELSTSLAHELNQPLAIILSNAQAAQRLLAQSPPDVAEVREILSDIVEEDRRAGEVIQRLRALLKRGEATLLPLSLNEVIAEVLHLANPDLVRRGVTVTFEPAAGLPPIGGDRVQLQQVVLNLILNGADAMSANPPDTRRLHVATAQRDGAAHFSVCDEGCGLPANVEKIFAPFFTTKPHGLGMGLAICRSIIAAHHGRLWAEPHPERGAIFHLKLPVPHTPTA